MHTSAPFHRSSYGRLFFLITAVAIVVLFYFIFQRSHNLKQSAIDELGSVYGLVTESVKNNLNAKEQLLKVLGARLQDVAGEDDSNLLFEIFDNALRDNPTFNGYALSTPEGEFLFVSETQNGAVSQNLVKDWRTRRSFEQTKKSNGLTIGHTYFSEVFGEWIIPMRLAVKNDNGEVDFVISITVPVDSYLNPWNVNQLDNNINLLVAHSADALNRYYLIYYENFNMIAQTKSSAYHEPIPDTFIQMSNQLSLESSGYGLNDIKENNQKVHYINDSLDGDSAIVYLGFDEKFDIFYAFRYDLSVIDSQIMRHVYFSVVSVALFVCLVFVSLIRIHKKDADFKAQLHYEATHDYLTGLPNRYFLNNFYESRAPNNQSLVSVLFIDLDNFKFINDHFGHMIGDEVLQHTVNRLKKVPFSSQSILIRHGGDEFIYFVDTSDAHKLQTLAKEILNALNTPILLNDLKISISASIGIASESDPSHTLEQLCINADIAMLEAKKFGNQYYFFTSDLKQSNDRRANIKTALTSALDKDEFFLVYQTQVSARTSRVTGLEALLRWKNDELGMVGPYEFIPLLESSGQIIQVGEYVIRQAFKEFEALASDSHLSIAINVSVHQFIYGDIRGVLNREIKHYDICSNQVVIEVTESLFIEDVKQVGQTLLMLREDGFQISLDDFGTGYSSLGAVKALPFNELKIDRSFVCNILDEQADEVLVRQIIDIGHSQGTHVVAEGVESAEQAALIKALGCDILQGFYFSKPVPIEQVKLIIK